MEIFNPTWVAPQYMDRTSTFRAIGIVSMSYDFNVASVFFFHIVHVSSCWMCAFLVVQMSAYTHYVVYPLDAILRVKIKVSFIGKDEIAMEYDELVANKLA